MSSSIRYIDDQNGNHVFPVTHERAVRDSDGVTLETKLGQKQNTIQDISTIRSGAAAGATAVQPAALNAKQDVIVDLQTIRSGSALGSTSVQPADIEDMVEAEPIGSIIPPVNPSEFATTEEVSQLRQEVTNNISQLDQDVNDIEVGFQNFPKELAGYDFDWQQGAIISNGTEVGPDSQFYPNRIHSGNYFEAVGSFNISCAAGFGYRIAFYDASKQFLSLIIQDSGGAITVNMVASSKYVRIVVLRTNNANITPSDAADAAITLSNVTGNEVFVYVLPEYKERFSNFEKGLVPLYDWKQGAIISTGAETLDSTRIKTGTYFLSHGETISLSAPAGYAYRIFWYNSSKVFVGWQGDTITGDISFVTTSGYYYRFVLLKTNGTDIVPSEGPGNFLLDGFSLDNTDGMGGYIRPLYKSYALKGKKVAFIGDSVTQLASATDQSHTYHGIFSALSGCVVKNLGVNGTCIADNTKNGLGSTRFVTRATSENLSDVSMVVVFGGTNDFAYDSKAIGEHFSETTITASGNIGTKQLTAPSDTDTFSGALHELITTIQANVPANTPIVFMTPLHRNNNVVTNPNSTQCNTNGDYMVDFVDAIKDICGFYGIPVLDLYSNAQLNPLSGVWSGLFSDGLHPNNNGHRIIGELLYRFIEQNAVFL